MINLGDYKIGATVHLKWNTFAVLGASITRATDGSIRVYKNDSVTQRSSANGITDTEDFDGLTGVHHLKIDLSDNTDAGFYAVASDYQVVLVAATIDGQTVNACLAHFSIENRAVGYLGTQAKADANAEVVDGLNVDTYAEPGQESPGATISLAKKINFIFKWMRNKKANDGSWSYFYNDAGSTVDQKQQTTSAAGTVTKEEVVSGP